MRVMWSLFLSCLSLLDGAPWQLARQRFCMGGPHFQPWIAALTKQLNLNNNNNSVLMWMCWLFYNSVDFLCTVVWNHTLSRKLRWSGAFSSLGVWKRAFCRSLSTEKWTRRTRRIREDTIGGVLISLKLRNRQLRILEYRYSSSRDE